MSSEYVHELSLVPFHDTLKVTPTVLESCKEVDSDNLVAVHDGHVRRTSMLRSQCHALDAHLTCLAWRR